MAKTKNSTKSYYQKNKKYREELIKKETEKPVKKEETREDKESNDDEDKPVKKTKKGDK